MFFDCLERTPAAVLLQGTVPVLLAEEGAGVTDMWSKRFDRVLAGCRTHNKQMEKQDFHVGLRNGL